MTNIFPRIAQEISAKAHQVEAAVGLLDEGATVPFIARYRKEVTSGLDDIQLRKLEERLKFWRGLEERRSAIVSGLKKRGVLSANILAQINAAETRSELEAVYAPFKSSRKTKADIAREAGLDVVAEAVAKGEDVTSAFKSSGKKEDEKAKAGVKELLIEKALQDPKLVTSLKKDVATRSVVAIKAVRGKKEEAKKWIEEAARADTPEKIPSHRALGLLRASGEGIINLDFEGVEANGAISRAMSKNSQPLVREAAQEGWKGRVGQSVKSQVLSQLKERAHGDAIEVFKKNLKSLLLAAPAGKKVVLGLDPGLRTGVKAAVVDQTGKVLATDTLYPGRSSVEAKKSMVSLIVRHKVDVVAIGNGTGGRETDVWVGEVLKSLPKPQPTKVIVSEAGASVYSASELASKELPSLDVSLRGAVSIARRLQDPLAELVKIDPRSLGVGQYQHDIDPKRLSEALSAVVEDAVASVGVDLNTASAALLAHVPGVGPAIAQSIVAHREKNGPFKSRKELLKVARLGPKVYEQCVGFLRIPDAPNPLDNSAVHPESYDLAGAIAKACGLTIKKAIGDETALKSVSASGFKAGSLTVKSVVEEMMRPGRDPRPQFKVAQLNSDVTEVTDLKVGMKLQGTVTNVAAFGAFVDIGVHQDGLIHISQLSDSFVSNPNDVVKVGDVVNVTVIEIDASKKRISLSRKSAPDVRSSGQGVSSQKSGGTSRPKMSVSPKKEAPSGSQFDALKGMFGK